jgi:hypothetical protein
MTTSKARHQGRRCLSVAATKDFNAGVLLANKDVDSSALLTTKDVNA